MNNTPRAFWSVGELVFFFDGRPLPEAAVSIQPGQIISDPVLFVEGHIAAIRKNAGKDLFSPYFERLTRFADWLKENPASGKSIADLSEKELSKPPPPPVKPPPAPPVIPPPAPPVIPTKKVPPPPAKSAKKDPPQPSLF